MNATRKVVLAHVALIVTQILFGIGSVVGELGLPELNPVLFALVREAVAGPLLCTLACCSMYKGGSSPASLQGKKHMASFLVCGAAIFCNQLCAITGIKLAGGVAMSVWQPTQPFFTSILAFIFMRSEVRFSCLKTIGMFVAFAGVVFMVLFDSEASDQNTANVIAGNIFFFVNCVASSTYVLASRDLLRVLPSIQVTGANRKVFLFTPHTYVVLGFSYIIASVLMLIACLIVNAALLSTFCPSGCGNGWSIPEGAIWALAYWIVCSSMVTYGLMTWANQIVDPVLVSAYTVLQPVASTVTVFVITAFTRKFDLTRPGYGTLGAVPVFVGLLIVVVDSKSSLSSKPSQPLLSEAESV